MSWTTILWIIVGILVVALAVLYFVGRRMQKKQDAQQAQIEAAKQSVSMLIIDKKRMKLKDAGLPAMVLEQTPKYLRGSKLPIVKAKIGPRIMTLVCEESIFDLVPVKKEVKAEISGIYMVGVKGIRGSLEAPTKKKGFLKRWQDKAMKASKELSKENNKKAAEAKKNSKKK
jgi:hypothetical protein